jgi:hypothetical protein
MHTFFPLVLVLVISAFGSFFVERVTRDRGGAVVVFGAVIVATSIWLVVVAIKVFRAPAEVMSQLMAYFVLFFCPSFLVALIVISLIRRLRKSPSRSDTQGGSDS